ncbi:MAG TPA: hypothetical protein VER03_00205 [Bryobacteraceae bacterium]|nr:hypothetical protein [Bryobacteraceae bacterium]
MREFGIPTVLDRFIQRAVMQVLQRKWDRTFFRTQLRLSSQAIGASGDGGGAEKYITAGYRWVVDLI